MKTINNVIKSINKAHAEKVAAACFAFAWALDMDPQNMDKTDRDLVTDYVTAYLNHSEGKLDIFPEHIEAVLGEDPGIFDGEAGDHISRMITAVKGMMAARDAYLRKSGNVDAGLVPPLTELKQITEVLKEAGLIRWDNAVQGWFIPHNVDDRLDHLKEAT